MKKTQTGFTEPLKVLIVEDTLIDRKVLERMLKKTASNVIRVKSATNLRSALKTLEENEVDVVVLDLNLPDSQGVDTLVKLNKAHSDIAVVVNTGAYEDDLGLKTLGMGAQDFIIKGKYKAYGLIKAINYAKERKRFELALQEAQNHLIQAEKMHVVGRLASGVAHEVKNPLATILFGVAYLSESVKSDNEKIKMTIKSINESAHRANDIIKDLLDFAHLSKLSKKPESLNDIVDKAILLTNYPISKSIIKVSKKLNSDIPKVNLDRNRIEQVLVNLMLNAIHAMPKGGTLSVKTYVHPAEKNRDPKFEGLSLKEKYVVLEVGDTGGGITKKEAERIFDPFFTTKRAKGGVGLGLSVAKNLIEMHNGRIFIENKKNKGALATVILPS